MALYFCGRYCIITSATPERGFSHEKPCHKAHLSSEQDKFGLRKRLQASYWRAMVSKFAETTEAHT